MAQENKPEVCSIDYSYTAVISQINASGCDLWHKDKAWNGKTEQNRPDEEKRLRVDFIGHEEEIPSGSPPYGRGLCTGLVTDCKNLALMIISKWREKSGSTSPMVIIEIKL
eukprot:scaffold6500_cov100-Skeletonema_marinoi.AAC.2